MAEISRSSRSESPPHYRQPPPKTPTQGTNTPQQTSEGGAPQNSWKRTQASEGQRTLDRSLGQRHGTLQYPAPESRTHRYPAPDSSCIPRGVHKGKITPATTSPASTNLTAPELVRGRNPDRPKLADALATRVGGKKERGPKRAIDGPHTQRTTESEESELSIKKYNKDVIENFHSHYASLLQAIFDKPEIYSERVKKIQNAAIDGATVKNPDGTASTKQVDQVALKSAYEQMIVTCLYSKNAPSPDATLGPESAAILAAKIKPQLKDVEKAKSDLEKKGHAAFRNPNLLKHLENQKSKLTEALQSEAKNLSLSLLSTLREGKLKPPKGRYLYTIEPNKVKSRSENRFALDHYNARTIIIKDNRILNSLVGFKSSMKNLINEAKSKAFETCLFLMNHLPKSKLPLYFREIRQIYYREMTRVTIEKYKLISKESSISLTAKQLDEIYGQLEEVDLPYKENIKGEYKALLAALRITLGSSDQTYDRFQAEEDSQSTESSEKKPEKQ